MQQSEAEAIVRTLREMGGDDLDVEAKRAEGGLPTSLRETLSSFSNTAGGTVILGVDEKSGFAITGIADPAKLASDLASMCSDELEPPVRAVIQQFQLEGEWVVTAEVPEIAPAQKPCFIKARGMNRGSYTRIHDGDHILSPYEVHMLVASRGQPLDDIDPVLNSSVDDLDAPIDSPTRRTSEGPAAVCLPKP